MGEKEASEAVKNLIQSTNPTKGYGEYRCEITLNWLNQMINETDQNILERTAQIAALTTKMDRLSNRLEHKYEKINKSS